ncbi:MAG: hypothetical protein V4608_03425 [Bacteroidota bacterium]
MILFHGTGFVARVIQNCDKSYYNHVGVVVESGGALFIVDANADGVQADRLSWRIRKYRHGGDFTVIKPKFDTSVEMERLLDRSDDSWIRYDYNNGIKELINRKFGANLKIKLKDNKSICSHNVAQYAINLGIVTWDFKKLRIAYPEDYIRYMNTTRSIQLD